MTDNANPADQPAEGQFEPEIYKLHHVEFAKPKGEEFGANWPKLRTMPASEEDIARGRGPPLIHVERNWVNEFDKQPFNVGMWPEPLQRAMRDYRAAAHAGVVAVSRFMVRDGNWAMLSVQEKNKVIDTWELEQEAARLDALMTHEYVML